MIGGTGSQEPPLLATVRAARGLTQTKLAHITGLSQAVLSKAETGAIALDEAKWKLLGHALNAPPSLLKLPQSHAGPPTVVFHRKRSTLSVAASNRLRAELNLIHVQLAAIVSPDLTLTIERRPLDPSGFDTPEEVACEVRNLLGFQPGPALNLVAALESAGVPVVARPLGSAKIDALMSWPPGCRPVVVLGTGDHVPGDRQRFSTAHELGHAIMHEVPTDKQEQEADRFASSLLMPAEDIGPYLTELNVPKLARLKQEWQVSMAALLRRGRDLGLVSETKYRQMSIEFSQAGYRQREPVRIPVERPALITRIISDRLRDGCSLEELSQAAQMTQQDYMATYLEGGQE